MFNVFVIRAEKYNDDFSSKKPTIEKSIFQNDMLSVVNTYIKKFIFGYSFFGLDRELIVIVGLNRAYVQDNSTFSKIGFDIREILEDNCRHKFSVWMGCYVDHIYEISKSYRMLSLIKDEIKSSNANGKNGSSSCNPLLISSIKEIITRRYKDENLTVNQIADTLHYTSAYICVVFKQHTGITVNDYINLYRIEKAKELLKDIKLKLTDVAIMVGYSSDNYFSKVFKKHEQITPSEYRKGNYHNEA
jgi:AraC-like DNA-binding protein